MTVAQQFAERAGVRIAYESEGVGPPLLLVHGLGYDRFGWGPLPQLLARDFRVVRHDNRGLGESDAPPGPYSVGELAEDALAVLDAEGLERAHVVGTSLGGMIAQELAVAHPERVDRLVLACTTPGGERAYPMPERTVRAFKSFPTMELEAGLRMFVENALSDRTARERPELVEEIHAYRLAHRPPLHGWQAQGAAALAFDGSARLAAISAPTLVLHGTADNVVDVRNAGLLAAGIRGARLELFEDLGHLFFWEEPDRFAHVVEEFLC
jgi:3-oxoadipate enol-lactonase